MPLTAITSSAASAMWSAPVANATSAMPPSASELNWYAVIAASVRHCAAAYSALRRTRRPAGSPCCCGAASRGVEVCHAAAEQRVGGEREQRESRNAMPRNSGHAEQPHLAVTDPSPRRRRRTPPACDPRAERDQQRERRARRRCPTAGRGWRRAWQQHLADRRGPPRAARGGVPTSSSTESFVDHRELEVRDRVVHRHTAGPEITTIHMAVSASRCDGEIHASGVAATAAEMRDRSVLHGDRERVNNGHERGSASADSAR